MSTEVWTVVERIRRVLGSAHEGEHRDIERRLASVDERLDGLEETLVRKEALLRRRRAFRESQAAEP